MANCWLDCKTVVVTGASGGMGAGIAATLIKKHGCKVIGIARSETKMKQFIEELGSKYAEQFSYRLFDVSVRENWEEFYNSLVDDGIQVDILINNAGILPKFSRFDRYTFDEIEKVMNINYYSSVYAVKTFLPMLLKSSTPGIINIDSSSALMSLAGTSAYSASKAALKSFTEAMREELRGKCYVGLVCPGFTKTNIFRNQGDSRERDDKIINMISTNCDLMVKMIMYGIEHKQAMQVHGFDAHVMYLFGRIAPVNAARAFAKVMKLSKVQIFDEVFRD